MKLTCCCITQRKTKVGKLHQLEVKEKIKKAASFPEAAFDIVILQSGAGAWLVLPEVRFKFKQVILCFLRLKQGIYTG